MVKWRAEGVKNWQLIRHALLLLMAARLSVDIRRVVSYGVLCAVFDRRYKGAYAHPYTAGAYVTLTL